MNIIQLSVIEQIFTYNLFRQAYNSPSTLVRPQIELITQGLLPPQEVFKFVYRDVENSLPQLFGLLYKRIFWSQYGTCTDGLAISLKKFDLLVALSIISGWQHHADWQQKTYQRYKELGLLFLLNIDLTGTQITDDTAENNYAELINQGPHVYLRKYGPNRERGDLASCKHVTFIRPNVDEHPRKILIAIQCRGRNKYEGKSERCRRPICNGYEYCHKHLGNYGLKRSCDGWLFTLIKRKKGVPIAFVVKQPKIPFHVVDEDKFDSETPPLLRLDYSKLITLNFTERTFIASKKAIRSVIATCKFTTRAQDANVAISDDPNDSNLPIHDRPLYFYAIKDIEPNDFLTIKTTNDYKLKIFTSYADIKQSD